MVLLWLLYYGYYGYIWHSYCMRSYELPYPEKIIKIYSQTLDMHLNVSSRVTFRVGF